MECGDELVLRNVAVCLSMILAACASPTLELGTIRLPLGPNKIRVSGAT